MEGLSLLWGNSIEDKEREIELNEEVKKDLDLTCLCDCLGKNDQEKRDIEKILSKLTYDADAIRYRSDIFAELKKDHKLREQIDEILHKLHVLGDLKSVKINSTDTSSIWEMISRLKELYAYIECIHMFYECMNEKEFQSRGLNLLKSEVVKIYEDSGFHYLKQDIERLTEDISNIKSLTLGVNLDQDLNPSEVQLVSLNHEVFKSQDNAILKAFITCFAGSMANSLLKNNNGVDPLMKTLTKRVEELLSVVVKDMRVSLNKYVDVSGYSITKLIPELTFYLRYAQLCDQMEKRGLSMCKAECVGDVTNHKDELQVKGFYNLRLALEEKSDHTTMITNDFFFDQEHRQYILTGPNRGGKTIFTQGVGLLYILAQAGVYVPADSMIFTPVDQIWTHFPADENQTVSLGRLGEESERLRHIVEHVTDQSLVLLNESLSSTSFSEGLFIAKDVMKTFNYIGTKVIYNTHMHELAADPECLEVCDHCNQSTQPNQCMQQKKCGVVSLVMGIDGDKRNYKAVIAPPTGNSYAKDIAEKYGILYEQMIEMLQKSKQNR